MRIIMYVVTDLDWIMCRKPVEILLGCDSNLTQSQNTYPLHPNDFSKIPFWANTAPDINKEHLAILLPSPS